jgi:hypothetical protein
MSQTTTFVNALQGKSYQKRRMSIKTTVTHIVMVEPVHNKEISIMKNSELKERENPIQEA